MFEIARNSSGLLAWRKPISSETEARTIAQALANNEGEAFQIWDAKGMIGLIEPAA